MTLNKATDLNRVGTEASHYYTRTTMPCLSLDNIIFIHNNTTQCVSRFLSAMIPAEVHSWGQGQLYVLYQICLVLPYLPHSWLAKPCVVS